MHSTTAASSIDLHTLAIFEQHYNWPAMLDDLHAEGCNRSKVSMILGLSWSTVDKWYTRGSEPRYGYGQALRVLHALVCGEEIAQKRENEAKKAA